MSVAHVARAAMSVDEAILTRRSVRAFRPDPAPRETVEHILDVAARAPSGTNIQPWRVYVLAGAEKQRLTAVLARRERAPPKPEFSYYPKKWFEPYLERRRELGLDLYGLLGIGRQDKKGCGRSSAATTGSSTRRSACSSRSTAISSSAPGSTWACSSRT